MRGESIGYSCNWKKEIMFSSAEINDNHLISENGKIAALISGRPAVQQHVEHADGGDTIPVSHVQKVLRTERKNSSITKLQTDHAARRGRDTSEQRRA